MRPVRNDSKTRVSPRRSRPVLDVLEDRVLLSASLSLTLASHTIAANGATTGTLTRVGTDLQTPLTVSLSSTNPAAASLPATVVIPGGQASATFNVTATNTQGVSQAVVVTGTGVADAPLVLDGSFLHASLTFSANALAVGPDGKVVVAGTASSGSSPNYYDFGVARYNANGTPDTTFNGTGKVVVALTGQSDKAQAVALQPDGKVVVAGIDGNGPNYNFIIARYNTNGSLDPTFGAGGKVVFVPTAGSYNEVWALAIQPDGKILAGGDIDNGGATFDDFAVVRFNPNGSLDPSFGAGGVAQTSFSSGTDRGYGLALQPDGRVVVAGTSFDGNATSAFALARFNPNGFLDPTFGAGGKVQTTLPGGYAQLKGVALQPDGKLVAVGFVNNPGVFPPTANSFALARYNSNGTLDTGFAAGGIALGHFFSGNDKAQAVAIQPDGLIDVVGQGSAPNGSAVVARFLPNGTLEAQAMVSSQGSYVASAFQPGSNRLVVVGNNAANNLTGFLDAFGAFATVAGSDSLTVSAGGSAPPVAANDSFAATKATTLTVAGPGVLANDTDPNGLPLSATLVAGPSHGTLALGANGGFTYSPTGLYLGSDSFTYKASDGASSSAAATVTLTVTGADDPPTAGGISSYVAQNFVLNLPAPGVLSYASDPNGQPLTAILVASPTHGTIAFSANGAVTYTPAANYVGPDSFSYQVSDGTLLSNVATDTINVARIYSNPTAVSETYSTNENQTLVVAAPGILGNDTDPNGLVPSPVVTSTTTHGTLTVNPDGSLLYVPKPYFHGIDQFNYYITDGHASSTYVTDTIFVNFVNYPPVAVNDSYASVENTTLTTSAPQTSLTMVSQQGDYIGQGLSYSFTKSNSTMLASRNFDNGVDLTLQSKDGTQSWFLSFAAPGNAPLVPGTYLGAVRYPFQAAGQPGLSVTANGRGSNTLTGQFTVTQAVFDSSGNVVSFAASFVQHSEGAAPALTGQVFYNALPAGVAPGVLVNDTDPNGQAITAKLAAGAAHGTVALSTDGSFVYTPAPGFYGIDHFSYKANNGVLDSNVATATIVVNAPPLASDVSYGVSENHVLTVPASGGVLTAAHDPNGDPITARLIANPSHGALQFFTDGSFVYTPASGYHGTDHFTFVANDGQLNSNVATAAIVVNAPPAATDLAYNLNEYGTLTIAAPLGVLAGASDPDGNPLTAVLVAGPANGTLALNADGSFAYTPAPGFTGVDQFTFKASDGKDTSNLATATLTVNFVNQAPSFIAGPDQAVDEDSPAQVIPGWASSLSAGPASESGQALTFVVAVDNPALFAVLPAIAADGTLSYTPAPVASGTALVIVQLVDDGGTANGGVDTSAPLTFAIAVNFVNDPPSFAANDPPSVDQDSGAQDVANWAAFNPGAGANEQDQTATYTVANVSNPDLFCVAPAVDASGTLTYTPALGVSGTSTFDLLVQDSGGTANGGVDTSAWQTFTIVVIPAGAPGSPSASFAFGTGSSPAPSGSASAPSSSAATIANDAALAVVATDSSALGSPSAGTTAADVPVPDDLAADVATTDTGRAGLALAQPPDDPSRIASSLTP